MHESGLGEGNPQFQDMTRNQKKRMDMGTAVKKNDLKKTIPAYNCTNRSEKKKEKKRKARNFLAQTKRRRTSTHSKGKPKETRRIKEIESQKVTWPYRIDDLICILRS